MDKKGSFFSKYRNLFAYVLFGLMTTVVNYLIYYPLFNFAHLSATTCNIIAWAGSVIFAFITNKPIVFGSHDWSLKKVGSEFARFVTCRFVSGFIETAAIFVSVDILDWDGNLMKLIAGVFVVVLNYVTSKLLVFKQ